MLREGKKRYKLSWKVRTALGTLSSQVSYSSLPMPFNKHPPLPEWCPHRRIKVQLGQYGWIALLGYAQDLWV